MEKIDIITAINSTFHAVLGVRLWFGPSANSSKNTANGEIM